METIDDGNDQAAQLPPKGSGTLKRRTLRNVISNWAGFIVDVLVTLGLTPVLVAQLGDEGYGVWILIGSLAGYLLMLDFGLRGSMGRFVAFYRGRSDKEGVLRTANTAMLVLIGVGAVVALLLVLSSFALHRIFTLEPEHLAQGRTALLIIAVQMGIGLSLSAFDAVLWGHERFDLINLTDASTAVLRGVLMAAVVLSGFGMVGMAWAALFGTVFRAVCKWWSCRVAAPDFRISLRTASWATLREIGPYGFWNFLLSISNVARQHFNPIVVGTVLSAAAVTPFSIAARLVGYGNQLLLTTVSVLAPVMTANFARDDVGSRISLVVRSGRICSAYALFIVSAALLVGDVFLEVWMRKNLPGAAVAMGILVLGEWLPMAVHPYGTAVQALAEQRPIAWRGIAECLLGLGVAFLVGPTYGLYGMAMGFAVSAAWFRGVFLLRYGGRHYGPTAGVYVREVIAPVLAYGAVPVSLFAALVQWRRPAGLVELAIDVALFGVVYLAFMSRCIPEVRDIRRLCRTIFARPAVP
ncbi:MAG: lipopolysaccharide biosynthesis protein [Planctomycetales bacterium]